MSTNYYACPKNGIFPESGDFEVSIIKGRAGIHIAKRSYGYKPLFHGYSFITSVKELERFIEQYDADIVDEYGDKYTTEQFNDEVINWGKGTKNISHEQILGAAVEEDFFKDKDNNEFLSRDFS